MDDDLDGELLAAVGLSDDDDSRSALAEIAMTPVPQDLFRRLRSRLGRIGNFIAKRNTLVALY